MPKQQNSFAQRLYLSAKKVRNHSYSPYSKYKVGAAIRAKNNKIYVGCNWENSSLPVGDCAEKSAIAAMISDGQKEILEVCVVSHTPGGASPCGLCRQALSEFATDKTKVHVADTKRIHKTYNFEEILPSRYSASDW
ncbi:MAG: cytidine deaminase [Bacteriovoracia bacterium]